MIFTDQISHQSKLESTPMRIISLVPSQTELLYELGYPTITEKQISALKPDIIFLSSEPYPFKEEHIKELQIISPNSKIILVNGEYFSWYGSRLQQAVDYFIGLMDKIP